MRTNLNLTLDLIRHAATERNQSLEDLIGQSAEEPINAAGKQQAQQLAERFHKNGTSFDYVYVSPYLRAQETCKIVCTNFPKTIPVITVPDLREINQGDGFNKSRKEVYAAGNRELIEHCGMSNSFPNGENLYQVQFRTMQWLDKEILSNPFTRSDKPLRIAIFTHGMNIKCILQAILNSDHRMTWRIGVENCSITSLRLRDGFWFLDKLNDTSHLS